MLAQFVLQLMTGISLMWVLMPRRQVTSGFFRIQSLLVLGLSVLACLSAGRFSTAALVDAPSVPVEAWLAGAIGAVCYVSSVLWTLDRRKPGGICLFIVWGLANLALAAAVGDQYEPRWLGQFSAGASAAVLGGAVTAMLLGHWYLTAPTMSIEPLVNLTTILGISLAVRLGLSIAGWWLGGEAIHGSLLWTWLALRWLAGIMAPLVLCGMTLRILRYRNTQAATGVLFAIVILTFIGEMSAALLSSELQRPF